jgi:hypothetical protein
MTTNESNTNPAPVTTEGTTPTYPYHYYLSVIDFQGSGIRTLDMELSRSRPIRTMDDVLSVKQWLRKEYGFINPQVSFSLLRNDLNSRPRERS